MGKATAAKFTILAFWSRDIEQTDGRTDIDAYEPTVHMQRCAQKVVT